MENLNVIEFHQTRDFSRKMNATFEFIRQNFKPLSKSLLFIAGPPVLIASFFISSFYGKIFSVTQQMGINPGSTEGMEDLMSGAGFWLEIVGAVAFAFLASIFTVSVVNNYMKEYAEKKTNKIETNDVWERVRKTLPSYVATTIFFIVALVALYLLTIAIIFVLAALSPGLAIFGGFVVFLAFFYIIINSTILYSVRAYEDVGLLESVSRSFSLMQGKWWSTFGLLFVTGLVSGSIASLFFIPWYITNFINMMHTIQGTAFEEQSAISKAVNNVFLLLYFLSSFVLQALPLIAISFQYFNLVERKEAKGLLSKIDTFGQQTPTTPQDEHF
jgi:hypothetical protein